MSDRPSGFLLSKAIQGFENFKLAGAVIGYLHSLGLFQKRVVDSSKRPAPNVLNREFVAE